MVQSYGTVARGDGYNNVVLDIPRVPSGIREAHQPWCVDCKVKGRELDVDGCCAQCSRARISRAAAAERIAAREKEIKALERAARTQPKTQVVRRRSEPSGPPRREFPTAELVAAYAEGQTLDAIAVTYESSAATIRRALVAAGVTIRRRGGDNVQGKPFDASEAIRRYVDGLETSKAIAESMGVSSTRVRAVLDEAGVLRPPGGRPGQGRRFSDADRAEIVRRYQAGESGTDIAEDLGCTRTYVYQLLRRARIKGRPSNYAGKGRRAVSAELADAICADYAAGAGIDSLKVKHRVSADRIRRLLDERGIPRHATGRPKVQAS